MHRNLDKTDHFPSNNHIQDVLLVSYLANTIRTQMDLSHRLSTAALTMGEGKPKDDSKPQQKDRQRGGQREQQ